MTDILCGAHLAELRLRALVALEEEGQELGPGAAREGEARHNANKGGDGGADGAAAGGG